MNHDINPLHHYAAMNLLEGIYRELKSQGWDMNGAWAVAADKVLRESGWLIDADRRDPNRMLNDSDLIA